MKPKQLIRVASLLVLASVALTAQVARQENVVPLKNWVAPLYWQPNQAERGAVERAVPELQFSANAVSTTALTFVAITPCRLVDTRGTGGGFNGIAPFNGPSIAAAGTLTIPVQSTSEASANTTPAPCGVIPSIAQGYSFNLTVVPHAGGAVDYVSMWPAGGTQPFVATLNDPQGAIVANAAIVPAGTPTGGINVFNAGPATTDVIIDMNGYFAAPTDVNNNTAIGLGSLSSNTSGSLNTAIGQNALLSNTTGSQNTTDGAGALYFNTTGSANTAVGYAALVGNTTGSNNTALGWGAMVANTTGGNNTATGYWALQNNTTGMGNTAGGFQALQANSTGSNNTAYGLGALNANTTGTNNTASGGGALFSNTAGNENTASGINALHSNTTGGNNTAFGWTALTANTTGSNDIAIGYQAALNAPVGNSDSIYIGSEGTAGDASGTISIGTQGTQTSTFIAGISGATASGGVEVFINSSGQLGTTQSSRRFKEQITDMGDSSSKLFQLRPVNFFYKPEYDDGSHLLQYGLIAEEVAKLYPEMVAYDNDGQILTVKYQMLAPMLLNEAQKQAAQNRQQAEQIRSLEDRLAALEALLSNLTSPAARPAGGQ